MKFTTRLITLLRKLDAWLNCTPGKVTFHLAESDKAHGILRFEPYSYIGRQMPIRFCCESTRGIHRAECYRLYRRCVLDQARKLGLKPISIAFYNKDGTLGQEQIILIEERLGISE